MERVSLWTFHFAKNSSGVIGAGRGRLTSFHEEHVPQTLEPAAGFTRGEQFGVVFEEGDGIGDLIDVLRDS
jgi:hypothetical protein